MSEGAPIDLERSRNAWGVPEMTVRCRICGHRDGLRINLPPAPGLTLGQELCLRRLCQAYGCTFRHTDYTPQFDLPTGWVGGWVGGDRTTLYVGVSPEGEASS